MLEGSNETNALRRPPITLIIRIQLKVFAACFCVCEVGKGREFGSFNAIVAVFFDDGFFCHGARVDNKTVK